MFGSINFFAKKTYYYRYDICVKQLMVNSIFMHANLTPFQPLIRCYKFIKTKNHAFTVAEFLPD